MTRRLLAHVSRSLVTGVALVVVALPIRPVPVAAQAGERVVFVSVLDRRGTALTNVTPSDLVIREDGVMREILAVSPATSPIPMAVLIDNSQAVESAIPDIRAALTTFVRLAGPLGPMAFITMADRPTILVDYTTDPKALLAGIGRVVAQPMSGPTLLDAVDQAAIGILRRETERAAIVVLGAALQDVSNVAAERVLDRLQASGASLHAVMFSPPGQLGTDLAARDRQLVLDRGTRDSGGRRIDVLATQAFGEQLGLVAASLRHQYRVVYARPDRLIPPKRLQVTAARRGLTVLARPARGQAER